MCGRYYIPEEDVSGELARIVAEVSRRHNGAQARLSGEIFPSDLVPVISNSRTLQPAPFLMQWGYSLGGSRRIINARSETAASKPLFRDGMARRRCLIPAGHYYEWERRGDQRIRYAIAPRQGELMVMAGIYRMEQGVPVFAILTRSPAPQISFIHDRMPVILPSDSALDWLDSSLPAGELLHRAVTDVRFAVG